MILFRTSALFCFVLFCFVLFCFVLFCFVLFCFVLFCLQSAVEQVLQARGFDELKRIEDLSKAYEGGGNKREDMLHKVPHTCCKV